MKYVHFLIVLCFFLCVEVKTQINGTYGPAEAKYTMNLWQNISGGSVFGIFHIIGENGNLYRLGNDGQFRWRQSYQWSLTDDQIPDGSTINSVKLIFDGMYGNSQNYFTAGFSRIELDLQGQDYPGVWSQMEDPGRSLGAENSDPPPSYDINHTFTSGSNFCLAVQNALSDDKFILGIQYTGDLNYQNYWNNINKSVKIEVNFTRPAVSVTVDQILSTNASAGGNVKRWETTELIPYTVPYPFQFGVGMTEVLVARQDIVSGEKYNNWNNYLSDVTNHHSFNVTAGFPANLNAFFKPTYGTITVKNELIDVPSQNGGNIEFKDPWLVDVTDSRFYESPYGYRNLGMGAPFKQETSPFTPTSASKYKGVFLNQGGGDPYNLVPPYYSVSVPQSQTIGNYPNCEFFGWRATASTPALFQNHTSTQTAIVFRSANDNINAQYKGNCLSSTSTATATTNQRKIFYSSGDYFSVYVSGGLIWYTKLHDGIWSPEQLVSTFSNATAKNPSIAEYWPYVHFVWEEIVNGINYVYYRRLDQNASQDPWSSIVQLSYVDGTFDATPIVSTMGYSGQAVVVWKKFDGNPVFYGMNLQVQLNPLGSNQIYGLDLPQAKLPSIIQDQNDYALVYINSEDQVEYCRFSLNSETGVPTIVTSPSMISESLTGCSNPSVTRDNSEGSLYVAWDALNGSTRHIFVRKRDASGGWQTRAEFSHGSHQMQYPSVGVNNVGGLVNVVFVCGDHLARKSRPRDNSTWNSQCYLGQGNYPAIPSYGTPQVFRSTGTAQPYSISSTDIATAPSDAILSQPPNNTQNVGLNLSLVWNITFNAATYTVQVATDQDFNNIVFTNSGVTETSCQASNLTYETWYWWRVRAVNEIGSGNWSSSWKFKTCTAPAGCPYISSWNGDHYILDNNVLQLSEYEGNKGKMVTDFYKLNASPVLIDGSYILELSEFEQERSTIDEVKLLAVDHDKNTDIAMMEDGRIVEYISAFKMKEGGCQCLGYEEKLSSFDGKAHYTSPGDKFIMSFEPVLADYATLENIKLGALLGGWAENNTKRPWAPAPPPKEQSVGDLGSDEIAIVKPSFTFRQRGTLVYVPLEEFTPNIFISFSKRVGFDFATLVAEVPNPSFKVQELQIKNAMHSSKSNVVNELQRKDGLAEDLYPGESIKLIYSAVPLEPDMMRSFIVVTTGLYEHIGVEAKRIPVQFKLNESYPNPFNPQTTLRYELAQPGHVSVIIFNQLGQEVSRITDQEQDAGYYERHWDATDVPSGTYFVQMIVRDQSGKHLYQETKKLLLMK